MKLPCEIQQELERLSEAGLDWSVEKGARHFKIRVCGKMVGVLPRDGGVTRRYSQRATLNVRAQIRRAVREARTG